MLLDALLQYEWFTKFFRGKSADWYARFWPYECCRVLLALRASFAACSLARAIPSTSGADGWRSSSSTRDARELTPGAASSSVLSPSAAAAIGVLHTSRIIVPVSMLAVPSLSAQAAPASASPSSLSSAPAAPAFRRPAAAVGRNSPLPHPRSVSHSTSSAPDNAPDDSFFPPIDRAMTRTPTGMVTTPTVESTNSRALHQQQHAAHAFDGSYQQYTRLSRQLVEPVMMLPGPTGRPRAPTGEYPRVSQPLPLPKGRPVIKQPQQEQQQQPSPAANPLHPLHPHYTAAASPNLIVAGLSVPHSSSAEFAAGAAASSSHVAPAHASPLALRRDEAASSAAGTRQPLPQHPVGTQPREATPDSGSRIGANEGESGGDEVERRLQGSKETAI